MEKMKDMKKLIFALLVIVSVCSLFASCQKSGSSEPSLVGTWKVVSSTDPVHFPVSNVTWTFGSNTVTISYDGDYESGAYRIDGEVIILSRGGSEIYITIVELSSSSLVLSIEGVSVKFQRV